MAIAGLILGYVGLAIIPVILIIAAIAIPNLLRARIAANEASAIRSVQDLIVSETGYASSHPDAGYTCSLADLADAGLIDRRLANGPKYGYIFELLGCRARAGNPANVRYQVVAYPQAPNQSGTRSFCSDESGTIKVDVTGSRQHCMVNGSNLF